MQALKKMSNKLPKSKGAKNGAKVSYTYPGLHDNVSKAVAPVLKKTWFKKKGGDNFDDVYSTHVMGKFTCDNSSCSSRGWGSKKVAIQIKRYPGNGYNAVVFNQRCRSCNQLGALELDEDSYVERVAYRLKKWAGANMGEQPYTHDEGPPHRSDLCEGCRLGVCNEGN